MRTRIVQETYEFAHGLALKCIVTRITISLINLRQFLCALSQRLLTSSFPGAPLFYRNDGEASRRWYRLFLARLSVRAFSAPGNLFSLASNINYVAPVA